MELEDQSGYNLCFSETADVVARSVGLIIQHNVAKQVNSFDLISGRVMRVDR